MALLLGLVVVALVGVLCGLQIGFVLGGREARRTALKLDNRFGPCPSCHVPCNLEEWRCGSCGFQLHQV